jgi:hypothetical protein
VVISELANNGLDAAIGDNGVIAFRGPGTQAAQDVSDASFPKEYFGIVVKQGNKALLDKLNAGLAAVKADGSYAAIYKKWFQADAPALPARNKPAEAFPYGASPLVRLVQGRHHRGVQRAVLARPADDHHGDADLHRAGHPAGPGHRHGARGGVRATRPRARSANMPALAVHRLREFFPRHAAVRADPADPLRGAAAVHQPDRRPAHLG